ncbi:MAG: LysE family translocator [Hyphomicrobiales bacterium]
MPVSPEVLLTFALASVAIVIVPGPTVTIIVANSMAHGSRAGFLNIAGTQAGLMVIIGILAFGLSALIQTMAFWFDWLRLAGAAYLVWLGFRLFVSRNGGGVPAPAKSDSGFFWQGVTVILTNPKVHLLFSAFLPQFIDPTGNTVWQIAFLGLVFMAIATFFDGLYAILAGRAGHLLSAIRGRLLRRISGGFLMGGGVWLATLRQS